LSYHSPHKFRHGHALYALKMAKDVSALKAVSQNLMHANLSITDGVYGILSDTDVKRQIDGLKRVANLESSDDLIPLLEQLLGRLKSSKGYV
jgi:integrase